MRRVCTFALIPCVLFVLAIMAAPVASKTPQVRMINAAAPESEPTERVYFYSTSMSEKSLLDLHSRLIAAGAQRVNCFLPRVVVCDLPVRLDAHAFGNRADISVIYESQVDERATDNSIFGPGWVKRCYKAAEEPTPNIAQSPPMDFDSMGFVENSVLTVPAETVLKTQVEATADYPDPRNINQNSELLIGTVLANLIFPESVPNALNQENWKATSIADATSQASLALLSFQSEFKKANINFIVKTVQDVAVSVEPINLYLKDNTWIVEVMDHLGYANDGSDDRHLTAVHEYNNDTRKKYGTQWVFTAFIADARVDSDHMFLSSRKAGWSFMGGPYLVIPHPASNLATSQVFKYYFGTIFWAVEEGMGSQSACNTTSGYLDTQNDNKQTTVDRYGAPVGCPGRPTPTPCASNYDFMKWYSGRPCDWTAGMMGISDFNRNSVPDALDDGPMVIWENAEIETVFTVNAPIRFDVVSEGVPNENIAQAPETRVNYAAPIKFVGRADENGYITQKLIPRDGVYDELEEEFEFSSELLPAGLSTFTVVTRNTFNATSEPQTKQLFYIGLTYLHFGYTNRNDGNMVRFDLLGETFDANLELHRIDVDGAGEDVVIASGLDPLHSVGGFSLFEYFDDGVIPGELYRYYVEGTFTTTYRDQDTTVVVRTDDAETRAMIPIVSGAMISTASPNPFNESTLISFIVPMSYDNPDAELPIPTESDVNVWVYDVAGRQVKRLYSEQVIGQVLTLRWDGTDFNNEPASAGVYFVKARAAGVEGTTKVVLVR